MHSGYSKDKLTEKLLEKWKIFLKQAYDHDSWGQLVEAIDTYNNLSRSILSHIHSNSVEEDILKKLQKIVNGTKARSNYLQNMSDAEEIKLNEIFELQEVLKNITVNSLSEDKQNSANEAEMSGGIANTYLNEQKAFNSLMQRLESNPDQTLVTILIEKIALRDVAKHIDPYFIVSCKDMAGVDICKSQQTPVCSKQDNTYLYFGINVELQVSVENMPRGSAVFFELFHYKQKKRMTSTKCFSFLEMDELKPGPCVIELYKKPTDFKRKKLSLLTSKPLYLHLKLTLHKS